MLPDAYINALAGGILIGLAAIGMMIFLGRIAGISGITFNAIRFPAKKPWAILFVIGLALGALGYHMITGAPIPTTDTSLVYLLSGGFLVGFGTKLGSGCTSGHGICGIGRLSTRSLVAVAVFMGFGFLTVFVRLHGGSL